LTALNGDSHTIKEGTVAGEGRTGGRAVECVE
jgi:hypothetical protein